MAETVEDTPTPEAATNEIDPANQPTSVSTLVVTFVSIIVVLVVIGLLFIVVAGLCIFRKRYLDKKASSLIK